MAMFRKYAGATAGTGPSPIVWNKIPMEVIAGLYPNKGFGFFDDFICGVSASASGTTYVGSSGQWIASAIANAGDIETINHEGGAIWLETAGTENDGMQIQTPEFVTIDNGNHLAFGARIGAVDADQGEIVVGISTVDTDVPGSQANDYVGFVTADGDADVTYLVQTAGGGVATSTSTDLSDVTTSTLNTAGSNLEVYISAENLVEFYIDGVKKATVTSATGAGVTDGIPTDTNMGLTIGCLTGESSANGIYIDWAYCYQWYDDAR